MAVEVHVPIVYRTTIRGGSDVVSVKVDDHGVRIALGPDGISASVTLDFGEARQLAESILEGIEGLLEEMLVEVPGGRGVPVGIWRVVEDGDRVEFRELGRRERDLVLMANPGLWPVQDRLFVKRLEGGHAEFGFLRPEHGPTVWDGPDLVEAFEDFEQVVDSGWRVD
jgi:hypothetical protein